MAEPSKEEDHMELTSSWPHDTIQVVVVSPASVGAAEGEGSDESAAGTAIASTEAAAARTPFGPSVSQTGEIKDAVDRASSSQEIYTSGPEAEQNAAPVSEEVFAKIVKKLSNTVLEKDVMIPTIYKVPDELKGGVGDHKDYRPVVVYLGFCLRTGHDRRECKLEEYKWRCVRRLIDQLHGHAVDKGTEVLRSCMESMKRLLPEVLASYSQHIKVINNDEMAEQMLLDGCLVLLLLLMHAPSGTQWRKDDVDWIYILGHQTMWESLIRDILLLENQIPFCVVKELFELLKIEDESEELLFTGSCELFSSPSLDTHNLMSVERNKVKHLLHLFYLSIGFPDEKRPSRPEADYDLTQWIPSAKELEEAGVRFRKKKNATSFLDISFDYRKGILEIPPLELYDSSSALFRNLIAFEQTYPETMRDVSAYIGFMDYLVNTPKDMRILHLRGILVNDMNCEQDTSRFFSQLGVQVCIPVDNYLVGVMKELSKYKDSRRHNWRAALVRNYFRNPWMTMSVFAAMLLLVLTFLQTFFTIYPYFKPSQRG